MSKPMGLALATFATLFSSVDLALDWESASPGSAGMDESRLLQARDYALKGGGSGCIIRGGKLVMSWGSQAARYDLKSTTKSIGVTALGLAVADGLVNLNDRAQHYYPEIGITPNVGDSRLAESKIWHLATHTAGFDKPGGFEPLLFDPGTAWSYSDGGANWLADCLTLVYREDLKDLMFERVFSKLGINNSDLTWRDNSYRPNTLDGVTRREFGSGISANVEAMAKIGYLYLRRGKWAGVQIIPESFVGTVSKPFPEIIGLPVRDPERYPSASDHYGLLWWNNGEGTLNGVPRDAYWSWGLHDSLIVIIPSLDIVVARAGSGWRSGWNGGYNVLKPFLEPICQSVAHGAPYGNSEAITSLTWADPSTIVRQASGSDNSPITWADDGEQYTAYGDGWGFDPRVPAKLSLGFCKVSGGPPGDGVNIRSKVLPTETHTSSTAAPMPAAFSAFAWVRGGAPGQVVISQTEGANWLMADAAEGRLMTALVPHSTGRFTPPPLISESIIVDGTWHRIGVVWTGSERILYADDVEAARDEQTSVAGAAGGLNIGAHANLKSDSFFSGVVDDVRIYDRTIRP